MAVIRRPVVLVPVLVGLLIGMVSMYMGRPPAVDAARPSLSGLQQQIDALEAEMALLATSVLPESGGTFSGDVEVEGNLAIAGDFSAIGGVQVGGTSVDCDMAASGTLRWSGDQLEMCDGMLWQPLAVADPAPSGAVFRWAVWSSYCQNSGWYGGGSHGDPSLFGGVHPQRWGDAHAIAADMGTNLDVLGTLFTRVGRAGANATVVADEWKCYSSTNSKHAGVLFRIRNTTEAAIQWPISFYCTAWLDQQRASIACDGANVWSSGSSIYPTEPARAFNVTIPANHTSTVIVVSGSSRPVSENSYNSARSCLLAFTNDCLLLPDGLEYVDDLDDLP